MRFPDGTRQQCAEAIRRIALVTLLSVATVVAQQPAPPFDALSRAASDSLPSPSSAPMLVLKRNLTSGTALVRLVGGATATQLFRQPHIWPRTIEGYGQRAALTLGTNLSRDAVLIGVATAFGHDARYQRCECRGFASRTAFALSGVVRRADGSGTLRGDPSAVLAALAAGYVSTALSGQAITRNSVAAASAGQLGRIAVGQIALEFRPNIRRWFQRRDSNATGTDQRKR